jgi:hypothetical protein
VLPVVYPKADKTLTTIGTSCWSVDYGLRLREDVTYPEPRELTIHATFRMYDIHPGVEPSEKLFQEVRGFEVRNSRNIPRTK